MFHDLLHCALLSLDLHCGSNLIHSFSIVIFPLFPLAAENFTTQQTINHSASHFLNIKKTVVCSSQRLSI